MKTLVEQLRAMVKKSREDGGFPTDFAEPFIGRRVERSDEERELFTIIADRIEREYISRPRFEDEEPVQFGDSVETPGANITHLNEIQFYENGRFKLVGTSSNSMNIDSMGEWSFSQYERVKRPKSEVLDADGVPIHVDDTVYSKNGRAYTVTRVIDRYMTPLSNEYRQAIDIECVVHENGKCDSAYNADPKEYTHKQPDTLERIKDDARKMFNDYWGCGDAECSCCQAIVDGKKPYERYGTDGCTAAQKLDLLRRQCEVLGRGQR